MTLTYQEKIKNQIFLLEELQVIIQSLREKYQSALKTGMDRNLRNRYQILTQQRFNFGHHIYKELSQLKTQAELMRLAPGKTQAFTSSYSLNEQQEDSSLQHIIHLEQQLLNHYKKALVYFPTNSSSFMTLNSQKNQVLILINRLYEKVERQLSPKASNSYPALFFSEN